MTQSRGINRKKWRPSQDELELVRREFPTMRTADLAARLGVAYHQVAKLADRLGLRKSDAWLNGAQGGRLDGVRGMGTRFQKGHVPWTQGRKGVTFSPTTTFKPGNRPTNYMPIGSFRIGSGYLQIKLTDTGYPPRDWVMYHRHVWERAHGAIAARHVIVFRDGRRRTDPAEVTLEVLECITRAEHMRRHTYLKYGESIAQLVRLRGAITRQINRKGKQA
jgi:hypothetical protein